jgi:two-component sensor histidine kinase
MGFIPAMSSTSRPQTQIDDLLLRETNHRCSNDLQLIVSLLALQSKRAATDEARDALMDVMQRIQVLARSRAALHEDTQHGLSAVLRRVCEALHAQAEPRSILVSLELATEGPSLPAAHITALALVVNELATNAIKHAFEVGASGHIWVRLRRRDERSFTLIVDDDGLPFPELDGQRRGLGLGLARRLVASTGGLFIAPPAGSKAFEIRVPAPAN